MGLKSGATSLNVIEPCFTWKLHEAVILVCEQETGGGVPKEMVTNKMGVTEETDETVLVIKIPTTPPPPHCSTLEVYNKTTIFIPVDIT